MKLLHPAHFCQKKRFCNHILEHISQSLVRFLIAVCLKYFLAITYCDSLWQ
jgi:hypothetical protein